MSETTQLLEYNVENIQGDLRSLFTDMSVGGIILHSVVRNKECAQRVMRDTLIPALFATTGIAEEHFNEDDILDFTHAHDWHLAVTRPTPSVRFWYHEYGRAAFSLARAKDMNASTGFGFTDPDIANLAFAPPIRHEVQPGDGIIFVDSGSIFTGSSTYHKVETNDQDRQSFAIGVRATIEGVESLWQQ